MKMKKWMAMVLLCALLTGCATAPTFETVGDDVLIPVMGQAKQVALRLPEGATAPVVNGDDGSRLFLCDGYDLMIYTLNGGDLNATVKTVCGYDVGKVMVLQSQKGDIKCYEWVWTTAGEAGDQIGRAVVLAEGRYHYCVCAMADAATAGAVEREWADVFNSVTLT
jgi:predicted small secreted protein